MNLNRNIRKSISVVIPTFNGAHLLREYLPSTLQILEESAIVGGYEVIVADDCSSDETIDFLESLQNSHLSWIRSERNLGFAKNINRGIVKSRMELTLLLNNDILLSSDFFEQTIPYFSDENLFGISCEIRDLSGTHIQEGAKKLVYKHGEIRYADVSHEESANDETTHTLYLCGGVALIDTRKLKELDGFTELFSPFYFEDFDLSLRAWRKGWKCIYTNNTHCNHCHSATIGLLPQKKVEVIFLRNRILLNFLHKSRIETFFYLAKLRLKKLFCTILPSKSHKTVKSSITEFFSIKRDAEKIKEEEYEQLAPLDKISDQLVSIHRIVP